MGRPDRSLMTIWRMRTPSWIFKATKAHSDNVILHDFHGKNDCPNAPQCYVIRTLPVLSWYRFLACLSSTLPITQQCAHLIPTVYIRGGNGMEINVEKNKEMRISTKPSLIQMMDQSQPKNAE